jgi:hypothetical protein
MLPAYLNGRFQIHTAYAATQTVITTMNTSIHTLRTCYCRWRGAVPPAAATPQYPRSAAAGFLPGHLPKKN